MIHSVQLPPPAHWEDFETLCHRLLADFLDNPRVQKNGRRGQAQHGVDVFGQRDDGWMGVQCKGKSANYGAELTVADLRGEAKKATAFTPNLSVYCLATTSPRDQAIQTAARTLTDEMDFDEVLVWSWDDIQEMLYEREHLLPRLYPKFFVFADENRRSVELIEVTIPTPAEMNRVKNLEGTYRTDPLDIENGWANFFQRVVRLPRQIRETLLLMIRQSDQSRNGDGSESVCLWTEVRMFAGLTKTEFTEQVLVLGYRGFLQIWGQDGFEPQKIHLSSFGPYNIYVPLKVNFTEIQLSRLIVEREISLLQEEQVNGD